MRSNYSYSRDYVLTANFVMMMLVPLVLISAMNLLLYLTIRTASRQLPATSGARQTRDLKADMSAMFEDAWKPLLHTASFCVTATLSPSEIRKNCLHQLQLASIEMALSLS